MDLVPIISFLAGMASVMSPCVLPVIPLVIGYSLMQRELSEILAFVLGLFSIFTLIIALTIIFTAAINYYLHYFRIFASILLIILGLLLLLDKRIFNFSFSSPNMGTIPTSNNNNNNNNNKTRKGVYGSFLWGVLTSLAWAPCYGSYLLALIAYSVYSGNPLYSGINLILYTAGFSFTIFAVAFLISRINMEKLAAYSNYIRIMSGFLIIIAGLYMLWLVI
jgi:cytochrome c-type biogenesis protein